MGSMYDVQVNVNGIQMDIGTKVIGNQVWINGVKLPPAPCKGYSSTMIDGKVYLDGYEFKNGKWKRTLRALWYLIFW